MNFDPVALTGHQLLAALWRLLLPELLALRPQAEGGGATDAVWQQASGRRCGHDL